MRPSYFLLLGLILLFLISLSTVETKRRKSKSKQKADRKKQFQERLRLYKLHKGSTIKQLIADICEEFGSKTPCENGGHCFFDRWDSVPKCRCKWWFTGDLCQKNDTGHPILEWVGPFMQHRKPAVTTMFNLDCRIGYKDYERDYMHGYGRKWLKNGRPVRYDQRVVSPWVGPFMQHRKPAVTTMFNLDCRIGYKDYERDYMHDYGRKWLKNGRPVRYDQRVVSPGMLLEFEDTRPSDSGNYTCVVNSGGYEMEWTYFVDVQYTPSVPVITKSPENQTVRKGSTVVFKCECSPYQGSVEMMWAKHNLINGSWGTGKPRHNDTHFDIIMSKLWRCGLTFSSQFIFVGVIINQTVRKGATVVFKCEGSHYQGSVEMMWAKHNLINGSWGTGKPRHNDTHFDIIMDWNMTHTPLVLHHVGLENKGFYTCGLKNFLGDDYHSAYLNVFEEEKPLEKDCFCKYYEVAIIGGSVVLLALSLMACLVCALYHKRRKNRVENDSVALVEIGQASCSSPQTEHIVSPSSPSQTEHIMVTSRDPWEFPRNRLDIHDLLGEGNFGQVKRAKAYGITIGGVSKTCLVAVKTIKNEANRAEAVEFEKELEVMKTVREFGSHINVINLLGCCTKDGPLWVIVELAEKGCLKDYLESLRPQASALTSGLPMNADSTPSTSGREAGGDCEDKLSLKLLVTFCQQIARGMEFLASAKCIHRDLAARNVLLTKDMVLKVADFGLARNGDYYRKTSSGRLPIKWMPPEALLHRMYSEKSDVWSFGILMWEIFSLGGKPYADIPIEQLYNELIAGYRLERPPYATHALYALMKSCWLESTVGRPPFHDLVACLGKELGLDYLEMLP